MKSVALIPLRAGSQSIPHKNRKKLLGRPLFCWALGSAILSDLNEIFIFTNDPDIADFVKKEYSYTDKVKVIWRDENNATNSASTESAMLEFSQKINYNYDQIALIQATSPMLQTSHINAALHAVQSGQADSALTTVSAKRFYWNHKGQPLNYNPAQRPRRQDFDGHLVENGAAYVTTKKQFQASGIRIGGHISPIQMPDESYHEIDEPSDWMITEAILAQYLKSMKSANVPIRMLVIDVDGVCTNGQVAVSENGEFSKTFSLRDGMGLELLREAEIIPCVITSENSPIVASRMEKLKIHQLHMGVRDKFTRLETVCNELGITRQEVAYLGDDINDLSNILSCGWSIIPLDAAKEVQLHADLTLPHKGGNHLVRACTAFIIAYNQRF